MTNIPIGGIFFVMQKTIIRLKKIEGQVRGLQKILEEDPNNCEKIITQFSATKSALESCFRNLLEVNLESCIQSGEKEKISKILKTLLK